MLCTLVKLGHYSVLKQCQFHHLIRHGSMYSKIIDKMEELQERFKKNKEKIPSMTEPISTDKYKVVYAFEYVRYPVRFIRFQYPLVLFTTLGVPFSYLFDASGTLSSMLIFTSFSQLMVMKFLGIILKDLVGVIYVNKSGETKEVIISSLNHNGRRINRIHDADGLICLGFPNRIHKMLGFAQISVEKESINYKLNTRNYIIKDRDAFKEILGDIKSLAK